MTGPIRRMLSADHERLDGLLARAASGEGRVDEAAYAEFRAGLLRHIAMEEKVLLADAKARRGGEALPAAAQLRLDHAAIAAMLAAAPDAGLLADLRGLLALHNRIEEGEDGVYAQCERLAGPDVDALLARLHAVPAARPAPWSPRERIAREIRRALDAAYAARAAR